MIRTESNQSSMCLWRQVVVLLALTLANWGGVSRAAATAGPVWVRVELIENTAEGPAYDRCETEWVLQEGKANHWRVFYGEARVHANSGWEALRPSSGCTAVAFASVPDPWTLRGSPYLLMDVALAASAASEHEVTLEALLTLRKLTGFAQACLSNYAEHTEKRILRVSAGDSTVVPVMAASQKEIDEFRVREL